MVEGPKRGPASRAPLFDRLFDLELRQSQEAQPRRTLSRAQVVDSIQGELVRLLNTRCADTLDGVQTQERTVVNYGLPDFLTLSPTRERDRQQLAQLITEAIRAYEPRLRNPVVIATPHPQRPGVLLLTVEGTLVLDNFAEPVSFPLMIESRGGAVSVNPQPADLPAAAV